MTEDLFSGVLERGPVKAATSDGAWLAAMLATEASLAAAQADLGIIPGDAAAAIGAACGAPDRFDLAAIAARACEGGNPVIPLVDVLRELVGRQHATWVHVRTTSQDILDTAAMLVARQSCELIGRDLDDACRQARRLVEAHAATPMIGRTLLQQAEPTTFGREAAGWLNLLRGARRRLASVEASLPVQLGGPVGTLRGYGDQAGQIVAAVAARLDLRAAPSWHTSRLPIADLAGALATVCGAVAKVSTDIILLAQREVGEVRETTPGRGGSSSMPHKHNPIAAISARASALRGPALAGHLFACMAQEHERAAGAWHAEWLAVVDLLRAGGSAAAWLTECLGGLEVEAERMAANAAAVDVPLDQRAINVIIAELTRDEQLPGGGAG